MTEWSKALDLGSSLSWRGFKFHRHQHFDFRIFAIPQQSYNTFYSTNSPDWLQSLDSNTILYIHTTNPYFLFYTACPYPIYFVSTSLKPYQQSCPHSTFHLDHRLCVWIVVFLHWLLYSYISKYYYCNDLLLYWWFTDMILWTWCTIVLLYCCIS